MEQKKIIAAPSERAKEQKKADINVRVKAALPPSNTENISNEGNDREDLLEIRAKIENLLDEQQLRASENESNLVELRLVLENLNYHFHESPDNVQIEEVSRYMTQVQHGQEKLQESISYLVKGAAQLFLQKNKMKIDKLRSEISNLTFMTSQVDEQIREKNELLEERLNTSAKIDATNAVLRRRIETTKNEIRAIAGQDFENIPELARTYQETMKKILAEEVELTKQLWAVQQQLEKEKKDQVQLSLMYQKVKDHPIRMAQLNEEMEAKIAALRNELFEKEKQASQQRGQVAMNYQNETQKMVIQARKEREEQLFELKLQQIQQLMQAEKQSREEKSHMIASANSNLSQNRAFKAKIAQFDRENKQLMDSYDQTVKKLKMEFAQSERKMKREHDAKIQEAMERTRLERQSLKNEVAAMEMSLAAKNEQFQHSSKKLQELQNQLAQLKEKIARYDISNRQLEKTIGGNSAESEELMNLLNENRNRKLEEKNMVKRRLMDVISSLAYFMVLSGEVEGDWLKEAQECYEQAVAECETDSRAVRKIPVPFHRIHKSKKELFEDRPLKKRRESFS
ncbi:hypothetical protein TRFO_05576 [Tritrichomonas foetus]|uniref:Uncharacterized protein n=1 Tax=Tritrichomonas foetus TaxID=1144522 RepID=A0A1J4K9K0_9EUKA|nr:hypothetical protein TRFO_05576 [Tritrichomonas foetus]|eukprot:OHT06380.1 hypothetical protein TRFO_05576 [Tritrichomonas foetus]